jgi:hypothetical protein
MQLDRRGAAMRFQVLTEWEEPPAASGPGGLCFVRMQALALVALAVRR